jgi:hypothetical protein
MVPQARATVMVEVPLEDMARDADAVVHGVVERTGVQMVMGPQGLEPHTLTRVRVKRWLGGAQDPQTVTIREFGGRYEGGGTTITGTPEYETGQEVIVFLEEHPEQRGDYRTYGFVQGKFVVQRGVPGVPDVVRRDLRSVSFARWAEGKMTVERGEKGPAMQLARFVELVRRVRGVVEQQAPSGAVEGAR